MRAEVFFDGMAVEIGVVPMESIPVPNPGTLKYWDAGAGVWRKANMKNYNSGFEHRQLYYYDTPSASWIKVYSQGF